MTPTPQQSNDTLLSHILTELRESNAALRESNKLQVEISAKVAVIHARTIAIFGIEGGDGGPYGRLKKMVYRHEKYFNKSFAVAAALPIVGGLFAWAIDHFFPGILKVNK